MLNELCASLDIAARLLASLTNFDLEEGFN